MIVKICGITNREDARAAVEGGASALGFNFYRKSLRYVSPNLINEILELLPANIWKVGIFIDDSPEVVLAVAERARLDVIQIYGNADGFPRGTRVWKAVRVDANFKPDQLGSTTAEAFLLDTPSDTLYGGTGQSFDWKLARSARQKVIIAGGLDETNVRRAIEEARPWGVDACSRLESAPGRKDHAKLARFLKAALS